VNELAPPSSAARSAPTRLSIMSEGANDIDAGVRVAERLVS
jgi:hypothetical protein